MNDYEELGIEAGFAADALQFLSFRLAEEEYAVPILHVQEIRGLPQITPIPNAPAYVRGVMNLRGTVVPVLDLRARFGLASRGDDPLTVVMVVNVGERVIGLLADAVSDVLALDAAGIAPPPELCGPVDTNYLTGLARTDEKLVMLLEIEAVVGVEGLAAAAAAS